MGSMNENEIKPVAWVVSGCSRPWWGDTGKTDADWEAKGIGGAAKACPLYDQSAIDRLTAERDGYLKQHSRDSAELRRICAQRDSLRDEALRYREVIEYALAQHSGRHTDGRNHWAAKAMNELAAIDATHAKELRG
ncbi:hypothetical protein [Stenotrophomonas sp. PS02297]|uniref:hypothetical protein n=1 Tax=Stenotrophomonas sp. PS02297 TaxID=2991423 RepID=UPI00249A871A|nr:hypothetical protein [Stenotrophomonas sp. PS02297]